MPTILRGRTGPASKSGSLRPRLKVREAHFSLREAHLNAATAVDGEDLTGDVGRVFRQEQGGARDVLRSSVALEGGLVDDFAL